MTNITYDKEMKRQELNQFLIDFYREQYLKFLRIGINNETEYGVTVTKKLITSTANRLDQLIKGKKTKSNMSDIEKGICKSRYPRKLYNSNRSFIGDIKSKFQLSDLEITQQHAVCSYIDYSDCYPQNESHYIDKITTAYNSETMREVLSHNN